MALKLYLDEDVDPLLSRVLRDRNMDCLATQEANNRGLSDHNQLAFAAAQGRAILTFNVKDFVKLASEYAVSGRHSGKSYISFIPIAYLFKAHCGNAWVNFVIPAEVYAFWSGYPDLGPVSRFVPPRK